MIWIKAPGCQLLGKTGVPGRPEPAFYPLREACGSHAAWTLLPRQPSLRPARRTQSALSVSLECTRHCPGFRTAVQSVQTPWGAGGQWMAKQRRGAFPTPPSQQCFIQPVDANTPSRAMLFSRGEPAICMLLFLVFVGTALPSGPQAGCWNPAWQSTGWKACSLHSSSRWNPQHKEKHGKQIPTQTLLPPLWQYTCRSPLLHLYWWPSANAFHTSSHFFITAENHHVTSSV